MRLTNTVTAPKTLLSDRAKAFGFGMWNQKLEGTLTLTTEALVFDPPAAEPVVIPVDSIQAVEAGYFRVGPLPGTPILRILHSDNVVWAVSVDRPEVWEESIRALAPNAHPTQNVPRQSKGFRILVGIVLLAVLLLSIAIPVASSLSHSRQTTPLQEAGD